MTERGEARVGGQPEIERVPGHCALCISRCGSVAVIRDGRFVALEPDPSHPTGQALCSKGRAAPELVQSCQRGGKSWACGREARDALQRLVSNAATQCGGTERDQYQRLLVICRRSPSSTGAVKISP